MLMITPPITVGQLGQRLQIRDRERDGYQPSKRISTALAPRPERILPSFRRLRSAKSCLFVEFREMSASRSISVGVCACAILYGDDLVWSSRSWRCDFRIATVFRTLDQFGKRHTSMPLHTQGNPLPNLQRCCDAKRWTPPSMQTSGTSILWSGNPYISSTMSRGPNYKRRIPMAVLPSPFASTYDADEIN